MSSEGLSQGFLKNYKKALTQYNKNIAKQKKNSWQKFCEVLENESVLNRWKKTLSKEHKNKIGSLKLNDGRYTEEFLISCSPK